MKKNILIVVLLLTNLFTGALAYSFHEVIVEIHNMLVEESSK